MKKIKSEFTVPIVVKNGLIFMDVVGLQGKKSKESDFILQDSKTIKVLENGEIHLEYNAETGKNSLRIVFYEF